MTVATLSDFDAPEYDRWNPPAGDAVNLWEGYGVSVPPTKVMKKGEWTCPHHGSRCSPGICKERARFKRDERMRKKAEAMGKGESEWRSPPLHLCRNASGSASASTNSGSDSDISHKQGTVFV